MSDILGCSIATSSPDLSSLAESFVSEDDRIDSDIEADILRLGSIYHKSTNNLDHECNIRTESEASSKSPKFSKDFSAPVFIREAVLSGVSNQLENVNSKIDIGSPSCICFRKYLIIGTNKGVIFVFNLYQVLRLCFGTISPPNTPEAKAGEAQGPITSLGQNFNGTRLLSGYRSGRIAIWQLPASMTCQKDDADTIKGRLHSTRNDQFDQNLVGHDLLCPKVTENSDNLQVNEFHEGRKVHTLLSTTSSFGRLLCLIDDAHGIGHAINFCCFSTIKTLAVCVDTGGSVFQLKFTKGLVGVKCESVCFFSGSRGEICALEPLGLNHLKINEKEKLSSNGGSKYFVDSIYSLCNYALIAMASFTKLIIVQLRPQVRVSYWQTLKGPGTCLPHLNWHWSASSTNDKALLVYGRGDQIYLLQIKKLVNRSDNLSLDSFQSTDLLKTSEVKKSNENVLDFQLIYSYNLNYEIINLKWISYNQLIAIDRNENLHLFNSENGEELESMDISSLQICYNAEIFIRSEINNAVSEALALAVQNSCNHSVSTHGSQMLILGRTGLHLIALRTWHETVINLIRCKQVELALNYCESALIKHKDKSNRDVQDFGRNELIKLSNLENQIISILRDEFLVLMKNQSDDNRWIWSQEVMCSVVKIVCNIGQIEFIWDELYPLVEEKPLLISYLFYALSHTLKSLPLYGQLNAVNKLKSSIPNSNHLNLIHFPPNIAMHLIEWFLKPDSQTNENSDNISCLTTASSSNLSADQTSRKWAEICLLRLHPSSLDINRAVKLCWIYELYESYLHLYTDILMDFDTPLVELFTVLQNSLSCLEFNKFNTVNPEQKNTQKCFQALLLLIRCGFSGKSFAHIPLPQPLDKEIPNKILNYLLSDSPVISKSSPASFTKLQIKYPQICLLLEYGVIDFLNLLTLAIPSDQLFQDSENGLTLRRRLYHNLITAACIINKHNSSSTKVSENQSLTSGIFEYTNLTIPCQVIIFLSRQLIDPQSERINIDNLKMYELFRTSCDSYSHLSRSIASEFESAIVELIKLNRINQIDDCLHIASDKELFKVCEYIYHLRGEHIHVFRNQLNNLKRLILNKSGSSKDNNMHSDSDAVQLAGHIFTYLKSFHINTDLNERTEQETVKLLCFKEANILASWDNMHTLNILYNFCKLPIFPLVEMIISSADNTESGENACYNLLCAYYKFRLNFMKLESLDGQDIDEMDDSQTSQISLLDSKFSNHSNDWQEFIMDPNPEVAELFIRLLIKRTDSTNKLLLKFLQSNNDYCVETVLQLLKLELHSYEIAYLHEKVGNLEKASELYEKTFLNAWSGFLKNVFDQTSNPKTNFFTDRNECNQTSNLKTPTPTDFHLDSLKIASQFLLDFCLRRCSNLNDEGQTEAIWLRVLDLLMHCEIPFEDPNLNRVLNNVLQNIFSTIINHLSPIKIVSHLLQSTKVESINKLDSKIDSLVNKLFSTCHFETNQLKLHACLSVRDLTAMQFLIQRQFQNGLGIRHSICSLCELDLYSQELSKQQFQKKLANRFGSPKNLPYLCKYSNAKKIIAFRCGHVFHQKCIEQQCVNKISNTISYAPQPLWFCLKCYGKTDLPYFYQAITPKDNLSNDNNSVSSDSSILLADNDLLF